jgi:hypothetical protein
MDVSNSFPFEAVILNAVKDPCIFVFALSVGRTPTLIPL